MFENRNSFTLQIRKSREKKEKKKKKSSFLKCNVIFSYRTFFLHLFKLFNGNISFR